MIPQYKGFLYKNKICLALLNTADRTKIFKNIKICCDFNL